MSDADTNAARRAAQTRSARVHTGWATLGSGDTMELAGMGRRLAARLIDLALWILMFVAAVMLLLADGGLSTALGILLIVVLSVGVLIYEPAMTAVCGATVGKQAVGIRVVNDFHGGPVGWGRSAIRWGIPTLLGLMPIIGFFAQMACYASPLWDSARQGWHDRAACTVVVKA